MVDAVIVGVITRDAFAISKLRVALDPRWLADA
jgi:hypothetical protein